MDGKIHFGTARVAVHFSALRNCKASALSYSFIATAYDLQDWPLLIQLYSCPPDCLVDVVPSNTAYYLKSLFHQNLQLNL